MALNILRGDEWHARILLRSTEDDVGLRHEEHRESDRGGDTDAEGQRHLGLVAWQVDGNDGEPEDAGGVHGETDEFGLIEVLW